MPTGSRRRSPHQFIGLLLLIPLASCRGCGRGDDTPSSTASASQTTSAASAAPALAAVQLTRGAWTDLAQRLVSASSVNDAVLVTREVLARGGVPTFDGDRTVIEAMGPPTGFQTTPREVVALAVEARHRRSAGRLTAAELAQMLQTFGFRFAAVVDRAGGDVAAEGPRGTLDEPLQEAILAERRDRSAKGAETSRQDIAREDAQREADNSRDAVLIKKIQDATLAWQKARQMLAKAPADLKPAAEAELQQAAAARTAAIEERRTAQEASRSARNTQREQARHADDQESRLSQARRSIGPDYRAGEQLMHMLGEWVRAAAANPSDPRSFTPLFLAEMARLQDPPVDLAGPDYRRLARGPGAPVNLKGWPRSQQLRLTVLEIQLMAAAFHRGSQPARAWRMPSFGLEAIVTAQDPCSDFKKTLGSLNSVLGEGAGIAASEGVGQGLERAVQAVTGQGEAFGTAMSALGMAAKIGKLLSFYNNNQITVSASPTSTHKPPEGPALVDYTATAGLSEDDWKQVEEAMKGTDAKIDRAIRDCFNQLGLPTQPELSDLAKEAEDWLVEWRLTEGSPPHAYLSLKNNRFYLPGRLAMKLQRSGPYGASAKLVVDILPEAERTGKIVRTYVTAQASLDAAGMPSLGTLINAAKGGFGLADALLELFIGWYQFMNMPKAYATVEVEYHCPKPATYVPTDKPIGDGGGGDGPQDCLIEEGR